MPTIDAIQAAVPHCPGISSNISHNRTHREPCGRALRWDHAAGAWCCCHHGPRLDGEEAADRLST
jgi:hypothetical protein